MRLYLRLAKAISLRNALSYPGPKMGRANLLLSSSGRKDLLRIPLLSPLALDSGQLSLSFHGFAMCSLTGDPPYVVLCSLQTDYLEIIDNYLFMAALEWCYMCKYLPCNP